ncbi:MAG: cytochrome c3 family protein [Bryobacterales bacterium]|nr:cytochrome c3 family protein [Bryobacterales bacterium]
MATIRAEDATSVALPDLEAPRPSGRETVPAEGFSDVPPFQTLARIPHVETYPCSQCHNEPLKVLVANRPKEEPLSHWQVTMQHAPEEMMSCQTCHGAGNMDDLEMLNGKPASYNAPYTLCSQCHMTQAKDWAGGAHGKRLDGWAGERVVENCTGCHNPHAPAFAVRWPAQLKRGVR